MNRLILTDVDDTCLDFANAFERYALTRGWQITGRLRDMYSLETFFGIDRDAAVARLHEFIRDEGHAQPAEPCARTVIPRLYEDGYEFVAITACGLDPVFRARRVRNLEAEFGFRFDDVHVVDLKAEKTPILSLYPEAIWVEDHYGHACAGADLGHKTFLIDRPYNRAPEHPGVIRVRDWHHIAEFLR